jgi:hypothetical protein
VLGLASFDFNLFLFSILFLFNELNSLNFIGVVRRSVGIFQLLETYNSNHFAANLKTS